MKKHILTFFLSLFTFYCFAQQQSFEFFRWNEVNHPLYRQGVYNELKDSKGNFWTYSRSKANDKYQVISATKSELIIPSPREKSGYLYNVNNFTIDENDNKLLIVSGYTNVEPRRYDNYLIITDTLNNSKYIHAKDVGVSDTLGYWYWQTAQSIKNKTVIVTGNKLIWLSDNVIHIPYSSAGIGEHLYNYSLISDNKTTLYYTEMVTGGYKIVAFYTDGSYKNILPEHTIKDFIFDKTTGTLKAYTKTGVFLINGTTETFKSIPDYDKVLNSGNIYPFSLKNENYFIEGILTTKGISLYNNNNYTTYLFSQSISKDSINILSSSYLFKHLNLQKDSTLSMVFSNPGNIQELYLLSLKNNNLKLHKTYNISAYKIPSPFSIGFYIGSKHTYFYSFETPSIIRIVDDISTTIPVSGQTCRFSSKSSDIRADENYLWINNEGVSDTSKCKVVRLSHDKYFINGQVYYDADNDGYKDNNEFTYSDLKLLVSPSGLQVIPDKFGKYAFAGDEGISYTVKVLDSTRFSSIKINKATYEIGVKLKEEKPEIQASFIISASRCNTIRPSLISLTNKGVIPVQKTVIKLASNDKMELLQSDVIVDTAVFTYNDIIPQKSINEIFDIKWGAAEQVGQTATLKIVTELYNNDVLIATKLDSIETIIRCSYDPNDKSVTPAGMGDEHFTLPNSSLQYLIRFENTGNDTAYNVVIYDTLNTALDYNTLKVIGYSHAVNTEITKNGIIAFHFNNIMLPDKATGGDKASGFVRFSIDQKAGIEDYTNICNKAAIVFDENKPIITNEVCNLIVENNPILAGNKAPKSSTFFIYPNPASDKINIPENTVNFTITNTYGVEMFVKGEDVSGLAPGIYIVKLKMANGVVETEKLIISR